MFVKWIRNFRPRKAIVAESAIAVKCAFQKFKFSHDDLRCFAHMLLYGEVIRIC